MPDEDGMGKEPSILHPRALLCSSLATAADQVALPHGVGTMVTG